MSLSEKHNSHRIAFVSPRFAEAGAVGGAETLICSLARSALAAGRDPVLLSTCARDHFTWHNELPPGETLNNGLPVILFPVDASRDAGVFLSLQASVDRGRQLSGAEEDLFLTNSVNSKPLIEWLLARRDTIDRVVVGPYLFGLTEAVSRCMPEKTLLVPCLHDEPVARLKRMAAQFSRVRGCLFNTEPEQMLADRLYGARRPGDAVVGMGITDFRVDPEAFKRRRHLSQPYVIYSGRRESLKGTPLLFDYLDAFRRRTGRDVKLVLTGSGAINPPESLRPHILDLGYVPENEKREAMAGAVAFCHPSLNESLSIVLLEAWLAGTPALVHERGAVLRYQCRRAGGGLWFSDYPEFETALLFLLDRPDIRHALGRQGGNFTREVYAPEAVARRLLQALDR